MTIFTPCILRNDISSLSPSMRGCHSGPPTTMPRVMNKLAAAAPTARDSSDGSGALLMLVDDLGSFNFDKDGYLYLEGRNSEMIKVGAHRVNPLEIEEVINKLDFVSESALIGVEDELLGQKLRAFIVGEE